MSKKNAAPVMNRKDLVSELISNTTTAWEEEDRAMLEGLSDVKFADILIANVNVDDPEEDEEDDEEAPKPKKKVTGNQQDPAPAPKPAKVVLNEQEWMASAPPQIQGILKSAMGIHDRTKKGLVDAITANASNKFPKAKLDAMDVEDLQNLATLAGIDLPGQVPVGNANYFGAQGGSSPEPQEEKLPDPLPTPTMNWDRK